MKLLKAHALKPALLAGLWLSFASAHGQTLTDEIDRFTGQRKIGYTSKEKMQFGVPHVSLFGQQGGKVNVNGVKFMISPELGRYAIQSSMKYIGCRNIDWLLDGKPFELGVVVHNFQRFDSVLVEFVTQAATTEQLASIGNAQSVEFRICGTEGRFSATDIAAARELASRLGNAAPEQPPALKPAQPAMQYQPKF